MELGWEFLILAPLVCMLSATQDVGKESAVNDRREIVNDIPDVRRFYEDVEIKTPNSFEPKKGCT